MAEKVSIKPELIRWAIERSRVPKVDLVRAFPKIDEWLSAESEPSIKQLEKFATKTFTPFGYLFLDDPPDETLPIPDFRTFGDKSIKRPSPNLIETIHIMQRRQAWMREYVIEEGQDSLWFVRSATIKINITELANNIRETLGLHIDWAEELSEWSKALDRLRSAVERIGIIAFFNSMVRNNTHRPLDHTEFRGFVLCDEYAPLVFVNSNDTKSAQMFTLAHELVHIWIGAEGLFDLAKLQPHSDSKERFCNQVAAEFLVPENKIRNHWNEVRTKPAPFETLARLFKVSPLVAARRALDLQLISKEEFFVFYKQDQDEWQNKKAKAKALKKKGGPNFIVMQDWRLGRRFGRAVVCAAREGRLLYRDAYQLTDLKGETFDRFASRLMQGMTDE